MASNTSRVIGIGILAVAAVVAWLWWDAGGSGARTLCSGTVCSIDITIGSNVSSCTIIVSDETEMPLGTNRATWTIKTPGYSFVPGAGVVIQGPNAGDFTAALSSATVFNLLRSSTVPAGRVYEYTLNIRKNGGSENCMVPQRLPRIKNT